MIVTSYSVLEHGGAFEAIRNGTHSVRESAPTADDAIAWCRAQAGSRGEAARVRVQRRCEPGDDVVLELPHSEVCMHMRCAGRVMKARLYPTWVQLYQDDGRPYSGPITYGEAGVYTDRAHGHYYYELIEIPAPAGAGVTP